MAYFGTRLDYKDIWPRSEAATNFRLLSGHDCITERLYHIGTALFVMLQHHLFRSTALCLLSENQKYWQPKGRMGVWRCQRTAIGITKQTNKHFTYDRLSVVVCAAANVASLYLNAADMYKLLYFGLITAFTLMPDSWL